MAQIKHIAIRTHDVEKTAAFYKDAFGLEQVGVGQSGIYLTDGHLNIAISEFSRVVEGETMKLGVDHIGFQVDDVDAAVARIKKLGGKSLNHRNEVSATDPAQAAILLRSEVHRSRRPGHRRLQRRLGRRQVTPQAAEKTHMLRTLNRLASTYCRCTPPLADFSRASPLRSF